MARRVGDQPEPKLILRRITTAGARAGSVHGVFFRCVEPHYATESDLLSGDGSRKNGGRWNPPSSFATVYAADSEVTALAETKANHLYYGLDPADALPRVIVVVDVKLVRVIDLTDGVVRKTLGVSATQMRGDDWRALNRRGIQSLTQLIGRATYECGLEALIAPACDGGKNIVWFPGNLLSSSSAAIRNVDKL